MIVKVEDTIVSGNFTVQTVKAKVGQNGSWTDITEDMYIEISENSTIYVQVTDQKGKTYEKNRYIKCFDFTKPTLNAAVSDGLLSIQAHDTDSGIKAIYVNGYEFTDHTNGALNIRLQQFDAGYQYFTISAMDNAGNTSEIYKTANPYYTDPENKDSNEKIRHSSSRWMRQQPSLALQPHRLQTIPRQTAMEILFPKQAVEQLQAVQEHQPSSPRVREILLRIPTRAVTARLLKKARNFIQSRLHQKRYFIW